MYDVTLQKSDKVGWKKGNMWFCAKISKDPKTSLEICFYAESNFGKV